MDDLKPLDVGALMMMHESDFDRQIATAKRYPRSISKVKDAIEGYATITEEVAGECIFAVTRGRDKIMGPSARFAEIVSTSWGNARYGARVIDESENFITAQGVFHDLENNNYVSLEVNRRIVTASGDRYGLDMIQMTGSAAMSIAMRNVTLKGVPRSVWGDAYAKAFAMVRGSFETLESRRKAAFAAFGKSGVDEALVLEKLGLKGIGDVTPDHIVELRGMLSAIRDGDTSIVAMFGSLDAKTQGRSSAKADVSGKLREGRERAAGEPQGEDKRDRQADDAGKAEISPASQDADTKADETKEEPKPKEVNPPASGEESRDAEQETVGGDVGRDASAIDEREASGDDEADEGEGEITLPENVAEVLAGVDDVAAHAALRDFAIALEETSSMKELNDLDTKIASQWEKFPAAIDAVAKKVRSLRSAAIRRAKAAGSKL